MDKGKKMTRSSAERQQEIRFLLQERGHLAVSDLAQYFGVSEMTIRRDLKVLSSMGMVRREYGGATYPPSIQPERMFFNRLGEAEREKTAVGRYAAALIKPGESVILDAGTTTFAVAQAITQECTVITNSLPIATLLTDQKDVLILVTGGEVRESTYALVGPMTQSSIQAFNVDKLFLGVTGFSLKRGLTTTNLLESEVKQAMIHASKEVILVANSQKFEKIHYHTFADWDQVHTLVTDSGIPDSLKSELENRGVKVFVAPID
jgi:DeoR family fructose operon transcriptional repressor